MGYYNVQQKKVEIDLCSQRCVCKKLIGRENAVQLQFAGFSKGHNYGAVYGDSFFIERLAESWDGSTHLFGQTILRNGVVKDGTILNKMKYLRHPNLLQIVDFCDCTVETQYIYGRLANAQKGPWLLGPRAGEEDFASSCTKTELLRLFISIGSALQFLHNNGICHTDPADHNIIVNEKNTPILIDLVGAMPLSSELQALDLKVFFQYCIISMTDRIGIQLPDKLMGNHYNCGDYSLDGLLFTLKRWLDYVNSQEKRSIR